MMKKVVVFDLDDTLYKEVDYVKSGYKAVAEYWGDASLYDVEMAAYESGRNAFDVLKAKKPDADIEKSVEVYRNHKPDITLPCESVITLEYLSRKYPLALITDGRSIGQRNKIEALGIAEYFAPEDIIISEEFGSDKHSQANFKAIMAHHGDAEYFYIGDNPEKDFYQPGLLGWTTIQLNDVDGVNVFDQSSVTDNEHLPDFEVDKLWDVIAIIEDAD